MGSSIDLDCKKIYHIDIQRTSFKGTVQHFSSISP